MSLWGELKSRNVVRVGVAYLAAIWLLLQVADLVLSSFEAPSWIVRALIFAAALGFPCALVLAWQFEITPDGIKAESDRPSSGTVQHRGRRIDLLIIGLLVLAVAFLAIDTDDIAETSDAALPNTIAVLPFRNLSSDPEDAYFAAGMHEEIIGRLGALTDLNVISSTSVSRFENADMSIPEIARELKVGTVMEGSMSYAGDRVRVTARLIDAATDSELWSRPYERQVSDIFAIQSDIATNIAVALKATLSLAEQNSIASHPTDSLEAYESYLRSRALTIGLNVGSEQDYQTKLGLIEHALDLDPEFSTAWAEKSSILLDVGLFLSLDRRNAAAIVADAEAAALRAVELAPDSGVAHSALANVASWRPDWIEAESEYREALAAGGEPGDYGFFLLAVGKAARARDYFLRQKELDPLSDSIAMFIAAAHDSLGDAKTAMAEYEQIPQVIAIANQIVTQLGTDDELELIPRVGFEDRVFEKGDVPEAALAELRELYAKSSQPAQLLIISALAARFGDAEFALRVMEGALEWMPKQTYMLWRPVFSDVRALPRFKEVVSEYGLVNYWRQFGWPDFCHPVDEQDFDCN